MPPDQPFVASIDMAKLTPQTKILLVKEIEVELERRAYKDTLRRAGLPTAVVLNEKFKGVETDELLRLHEGLIVYGGDDREEVFATTRPADVVRNIRSTAAVFEDNDLTTLGPGMGWEMKSTLPSLKDRGVCEQADLDGDGLLEQQQFVEQPTGAICTAFLIAKDVVATAGHCATSDYDVQHRLFVFDYVVQAKEAQKPTFTNAQVYRGKKRLGGVYVSYGEDWAVVRLESEVTGRDALPLSTNDIADRKPVYMVGYPSGLPAKYAGNAEVVRNDPGLAYFVANLDAFTYNSGSPVFNATSNEVEGILVGGERDYVRAGLSTCSVLQQCPNNTLGCTGERVTRIKFVKYTP